jgi:hypothetical protein
MKKILLITSILVITVVVVGIMLIAAMVGGYEAQTSSAYDEEESYPIRITGRLNAGTIELTISGPGIYITGIKGPVRGSAPITFTASVAATGLMDIPLPPSPPSSHTTFTWMPQLIQENYSLVVWTQSQQWKFNQTMTTDDEGFRRSGDAYSVALGSFYGTKIGTKYKITFLDTNGTPFVVNAVLGECKSDRDTDPMHQYAANAGDVIEFVMDNRSGSNSSQINNKFGRVTSIKTVPQEASLSGSISGGVVEIAGTVNGIPIKATGTILSGEIDATGHLGGGASMPGGPGAWTFPFPEYRAVTCEFGWPTSGGTHRGIDLAGPAGKPIYAAADGMVVFAGYHGSYGNYVQIAHEGGISTLYAHLQQKPLVSTGADVRGGQLIGFCGSTGNSTGPHLHFEVKAGGSLVNPRQYIFW